MTLRKLYDMFTGVPLDTEVRLRVHDWELYDVEKDMQVGSWSYDAEGNTLTINLHEEERGK